MWKPEPHPLRWPLDVTGAKANPQQHDMEKTVLTELPIRPILHGEHVEVLEGLDKKKDERAANGDPMDDIEYDETAFVALAALATGLPENVIQKLKRPDFNGLAKRVMQMVSLPSYHFMTAEQSRASNQHKDNPQLLVPLKGSDGITHESIDLEVPDLMASQMMRKIKNRFERAEFISAKCTGLIAHDLKQLTVPDWNTLQVRVNHFLNETADYFPATTSTS